MKRCFSDPSFYENGTKIIGNLVLSSFLIYSLLYEFLKGARSAWSGGFPHSNTHTISGGLPTLQDSLGDFSIINLLSEIYL